MILFACGSHGSPPELAKRATHGRGPAERASLDGIAGTYGTGDPSCDFTLTVTKRGATYSYSFVSPRREVREERLLVEEQESGVRLRFTNLTGDEPPRAVVGLLRDGVITIQNYGNALHEYVRFGECEGKYIELFRADT